MQEGGGALHKQTERSKIINKNRVAKSVNDLMRVLLARVRALFYWRDLFGPEDGQFSMHVFVILHGLQKLQCPAHGGSSGPSGQSGSAPAKSQNNNNNNSQRAKNSNMAWADVQATSQNFPQGTHHPLNHNHFAPDTFTNHKKGNSSEQ
eukprot:4937965-Amphidinium_carterae.1